MVQEEGRAGRPRADCEHLPAVCSKRLAQRRRCEQHAILVELDPLELSSLTSVEKAIGIDAGEEHGVTENAVALWIRSGRNRRRVDASDGWIHGMVICE